MLNRSFSLHKVISNEHFPFDPYEYSRFKFGSKSAAREFGTELGRAFCSYVLSELKGPFVVISSPYCFIPTATFAMKDYFVREVNHYLAETGKNPVEETKIHRTITYKEDYGELSAEKRLELIQNDGFHIDKQFLEGKTLILLDDIKITGSHEKVIERMLNQYDITNDRVYVYFAELVNKDVDPKVENTLNYAFVKSLVDIDKIIKNDEFILNTRIIKYMLNSKSEEFKTFVDYQKTDLLRSIYHLAIGNNYGAIEDYKQNLTYLKNTINNAVDIIPTFRRSSFSL